MAQYLRGGGQEFLAKPQPQSKLKPKQSFDRKENNRIKTIDDDKIKALPILFEENKGQFDKNVKFLSRVNNFNLFLGLNEFTYQMNSPNCKAEKPIRQFTPCKTLSLKMEMLDANPNTVVQGLDEAVTKASYAIGNDQTKWLDDIPNYNFVQYQNIYQGINLVFRGTEQNLEYDFHVAPEVNPSLIQFKFDGAKNFRIDADGDLIFKFKGIELRHEKPIAYQILDGEKHEVSVKYVLLGKNRIGFKIGDYDTTKELVIDPIVYASYLGSYSGGDSINDIAVDRQGNIYTASDFRYSYIQNNVEYTYSEVLISKFNADGTQRLWYKVVGGSQDDAPYGMDVDADGRVYVTGVTYSPNFPLNFAEQSSHPITIIDNHHTGFVFQLNSSGNISYSTYLGGSCPREYGESIVADSNRNAYVTGFTCSSNFPTHNGFQNSLQGSENAYLTKYDFFGHISYSTLFGISGFTHGTDVFTDGNGIAYVTGGAGSSIYTTVGAYSSSTGTGFAAKFDTTRTGSNSLVYSTRIPKTGAAIAADRNGNAWIAMSRQGFSSFETAKITKLNNTGSALLVEPLSFGQQIRDIAVDGQGSAYFAANIYAPLSAGGIRTKIYALRPNGDEIDNDTIDASRDEKVYGIALGTQPNIIYAGGQTTSLNLQTTPDAYQPTSNVTNSFGQGFFAKVQLNIPPEEKTPVIFIPGIAGSTLHEADENGNPIENLWADGLTQIIPLPTLKLRKLSLNPDDAPFPRIVAVDALRNISIKDIYGTFLSDLEENGNYIQTVGCSPNYNGQKPTMFVFPYDWRLSNINSAEKLSDLVNCIQQIHPGKRVNILTHSMGGLVARRYVINHPNNHNVDKLVTVVAPWLGAPKAIGALFTGKFLPLGVYPTRIKNIIRFGEAPHQLLPSAWYFINGGQPLAYRSSTSINYDPYSYSQTYDFINNQFPVEPPYTNSAIFHQDEPQQDNWVNDTSGIKYYHFYGQMKCDDTIGEVLIHPTTEYPLPVDAGRRFSVSSEAIGGDGTVPVLSANRPSTMLAPNTIVRPYVSSSCRQDNNYKHNEILQNEQFKSEILEILSSSSGQQFFTENNNSKQMSNESQNFNSDDLMNYLQVTGVARLEITDENGNTNSPLGAMDTPIPEIDYEYGSDVGESLVFPHEVKFFSGKIVDVKFRASTDKIAIENIKGFGRGNATGATKYLDLQLPVGTNAWLKFTSNGLESLRYDADNDGVFETLVQPTFQLTGAAANDKTPPNIGVSFTVNNNTATVTINSTDSETGINQIRYIVNGETSDHIYNTPFTIGLNQSKLLYVSAEDNAGNRNLLAKWLDISLPNTIATQMPVPNANGWSKEDVTVEIKSLDDLGGSGVQSLTYSGNGSQTIPEATLSVNETPFTFPQPSTTSDFLMKSLAINTEGITNLMFFAKDKADNVETTKAVAVKIDKTVPVTTGSYLQNGSQMIVTLASNDTLSGVENIKYSVDGGSLQTYSVPFAVSGNGNHSVTFFATDRAGNIEEIKTLSFTIIVVNPVVNITSPSSGAVYAVGASINFAGNFSGDTCSGHNAIWMFDNISQAGTVNETSGTITTNYTFTSAGVYLVSLTVNNNCGGTGTANTVGDLTAMVVIYNPDGGFVTGGGWVDSPLGAYTPNPSLIGRASFGFNSKYQRGATVPTGNTEFQFRVADFNFKSTSYDWLVVGGARAQYKGSGTINNNGNYAFILTAIDGQINGGGGTDKFRIKIWNKISGSVIYDNQLGTPDGSDPTTVIGGGSIIIHRQ